MILFVFMIFSFFNKAIFSFHIFFFLPFYDLLYCGISTPKEDYDWITSMQCLANFFFFFFHKINLSRKFYFSPSQNRKRASGKIGYSYLLRNTSFIYIKAAGSQQGDSFFNHQIPRQWIGILCPILLSLLLKLLPPLPHKKPLSLGSLYHVLSSKESCPLSLKTCRTASQEISLLCLGQCSSIPYLYKSTAQSCTQNFVVMSGLVLLTATWIC